MAIHQSDANALSDTHFEPGELGHLLPGNACRLLDGRRTPGVIEHVDEKSAQFRWRITAFEDAGRHWDVPAEDVVKYQFPLGSPRRDTRTTRILEQRIREVASPFEIQVDPEAEARTEGRIRRLENIAGKWLNQHSTHFANGTVLDLSSQKGSEDLALDLEAFLRDNGLLEIERQTAELMVLNPSSGEWIKGMLIVLAEMGLVTYVGTGPRTDNIFVGDGARSVRRRYLEHRLAFVRAVFRKAGHHDVVLYRGMASERPWSDRPRSITAYTGSLRVARAFSNFDRESKFRTSYLIKQTLPIERLWMTYLETRQMNLRYLEAEVVVLCRKPEANLLPAFA